MVHIKLKTTKEIGEDSAQRAGYSGQGDHVRRGECQVSSDKSIETEKNMKNKITLFILSALLFALCFSVEAQQPAKVRKIGFLIQSGGPSGSPSAF